MRLWTAILILIIGFAIIAAKFVAVVHFVVKYW
jgi:hypothetical protein